MTARFQQAMAEDLVQPLANVAAGNVSSSRLALLDSSWTYSPATATVIGAVSSAIIGSAAISTPTATNGLYSHASPTTITGLSGNVGETAVALLWYEDTGSQRLIFYNDEATNLPLLLNGADVDVATASGVALVQGTA